MGQGYAGPIPMAVIILLICFSIMWVILNKTPYGRYIYAVSGNSKAAEVSGISPKAVTFKAYLLDGALVGVGSLLLMGCLNSGVPGAGLSCEMDAITAVIVGGTSMSGGSDTLGGTLVGAVIVGIINNVQTLMGVDSNIQKIVKGVIIVGAMTMVMAFSALALTGCATGGSSGSDSAGSDGWNIGYVNLADTDVFGMARESALTTELDGTGYSVSFADGNNDNQKQIDQTNAFLAKGVDALILVPADSDAIAPVISAANSKGTPVICLGIKANSGDIGRTHIECINNTLQGGKVVACADPAGASLRPR